MNSTPETATDAQVELAYDLIARHLPTNAILTITETDGFMISRFLIRVAYKSHKTGRTMSILAKGDTLPFQDDECLKYYTTQLVHTPAEVARLFSQAAWREKQARSDAWLTAGKKSNERVTSQELADDMIPLPYNQEGATHEGIR